MRITKKRAALALTVVGLAGGGAVFVASNADAATSGASCSVHGAVARTGSKTLICAPTESSPRSYRWREITGAQGPRGYTGVSGPTGATGARGPAGPAGAPGKNGADGKDGAPGKDGKDGVTGLQADGPYPGTSHVSGGNSDTEWAAGTTRQTAWVRCPTGKKAVGGGFSAETGGSDVQVVSSYPFSLDASGKFDPSGQLDNPDASIVPNAWVVEGYYHAATGTAQVRPWVVCATVS